MGEAYTPDLFANAIEPIIPLAKQSAMNRLALRQEDCHWERHAPESDVWWELGFARCSDGWRYAVGYRCRTAGYGGPIFANAPCYSSFAQARASACATLITKLRERFGEVDHSRDRLLEDVLKYR